jgi:hypothetical protein
MEKFMKIRILKIILLLNLIFIAACSNNYLNFKKTELENSKDQAILVYISKEMQNSYLLDSKDNEVVYKKTETKGTKSFGEQWSKKISQLSAQEFQNSISSAYSNVTIAKEIPALDTFSENRKFTYLVVPQINRIEIEKRSFHESNILVDYRIDVYNHLGRKIYSNETRVEQKGYLKTADKTFKGKLVSKDKLNSKSERNNSSEESEVITNVVKQGINQLVNDLIKSNKIK